MPKLDNTIGSGDGDAYGYGSDYDYGSDYGYGYGSDYDYGSGSGYSCGEWQFDAVLFVRQAKAAASQLEGA
jgi:hypothetical protein